MFYYFRSIIINLIKIFLPALLLFLLTPQLIHLSKPLNEVQHFLQAHQITLLVSHLLFCFLLYMLWPKFIQTLIYYKGYDITPLQMKLALSVRWYLLGIILFLEALIWWR
ncbi:Uncharacterised protein [Legionella busanensis]|uniref:Uncharacterized protein n=1 Tax=Legionella busanensis TaxID=190655 RepID=A0A378JJJ3_9GAMM|nr:hypothetical protein [Legionella busanensis]STX50921.1 Uncharacterised protein [Legionella busanensis]